METSVQDFLSEWPNADYSAIKARFGTPDQIVSSYLEELETQDLMKQFYIRKRIIRIVGVATFSIVLLWAWAVGIALSEKRESMNGYFVEEVVVSSDKRN